ncbi:hypothetical protein ESP57_06505 [Agromyces fucosus]|uniref:Uncharacterized protein n=1 Tax=Agromyces fucosus TaxID=41985 RepID=A0A4Q2JKK5_9MICO|nr:MULTISPECIES: hypothetical protein [Agromyces]KQZ10734.1 hypothetical protein ASD23_00760 [Agromyces sp. Root1464]RXZ48645.1 hypothetical protein ESP57_06505 [Agromyces fucosus]
MSGALPEADDDTGVSDAVAPDRPTFELRARIVETVVLVASVIVLRVLGVLLLVVSSDGPGATGALVLPLVAMVFDLNLLVWGALTVAVQFGLRSMRRPGRWAMIVLAAPVAVLVAATVRSLPGLSSFGFGAVLGNGIAWLDAGILTVVVALGVAFTAAYLSRERRRTARIAGGLLAMGGLLTLVLAWQTFETYFSLWGSPVVVTQAQEDRYLVTATLTLVAYVGAIVFAAVSRRRGLIITSCIVGCLGLLITVAAAVPADRFFSEQAPPADAPRGPTCMGEGDPNCIGG